MIHKILFIFMQFILYSMIGWVIEMIAESIAKRRIIKNRGFLIGPYCPIYGVTSLMMLLFLKQYEDDPWVLFVMAIVMCTVVEYLTGYVMEKLFNARWWDYSHIKFNINGRVCLSNSILFGALGLFLIYILNPLVVGRFMSVPQTFFDIIGIIVLTIFIIDVIVSFEVICKIKITADNLKKDYTEEITKKVKEILIKQSFLTRRLINAFPGIRIISNIKDKIRKK